jgi:membrane protein implicated in regulation of membrane protease activity
MWQGWGFWVILGLVLLVVEVAAPAFVALFFGLSALLVALLCWLAPALPAWVAWLLFAGLAVVLLVALRGVCTRTFAGKKSPAGDGLASEVIGQRAVVSLRIQPGQPGKVELRGSNWQAESGETLEVGTQVKIVKQESIVLTVVRVG